MKSRIHEDDIGKKSYYRSREEREIERKEKGMKGDKVNWFKGKDNEGVLQVQHTPGGELARNISRRFRREVPGRRILLQETVGRRLGDVVCSSSQPWAPDQCGRDKCHLCDQGGGERKKLNCWARSSTYRITCTSCKLKGVTATYTGETTNIFRRLQQHGDGLRDDKEDNVLAQHTRTYHPDETLTLRDFALEQLGIQGAPLRRQAEEGARILAAIAHRDSLATMPRGERDREEKQAIVMNSRREFFQPLGGIIMRPGYL